MNPSPPFRYKSDYITHHSIFLGSLREWDIFLRYEGCPTPSCIREHFSTYTLDERDLTGQVPEDVILHAKALFNLYS